MASGPRGKIPLCSPLNTVPSTASDKWSFCSNGDWAWGISERPQCKFLWRGNSFPHPSRWQKGKRNLCRRDDPACWISLPTNSLFHLLSFPNEINGWCLLVLPVKLKLHVSHSCISFKPQFLEVHKKLPLSNTFSLPLFWTWLFLIRLLFGKAKVCLYSMN